MNAVAVVRLLRPWQWMKNLMLFFPPLLSGAMFHPGMASRGILPLAAFCCASSASYVFNDLLDQERDAHHPDKQNRPLPSGRVARPAAMLLCGMLLAFSVALGWRASSSVAGFVLVYLVVSACYSLLLKHLPIVDIFCISLGFVLRLYGGGAAFDIFISDWLFLTVFLLSIFLSVGKRYSERRYLGDGAGHHRRTLEVYPDGFLESAMYLSGSAVLVTYAIYAISTPLLVYTVPLCMFGLLRYLMRIKSGQSGDPTEALLRDVPLLVTGILWMAMVGWSVYR
jgi:4-hydroxybenzoate polyprenyltransferase